jgi:hypothetical protein
MALLFAMHPLQVESVAWVSERKNLLSTFFPCGNLELHLVYRTSRILQVPIDYIVLYPWFDV